MPVRETAGTLELHLTDARHTAACGAALANTLRGGMVVTLRGELGTGKTTLVRGLLRARGVEGPIKSPTYSLVEHYPLPILYFYHFDFYRVAGREAWETAGFSEHFRNDAVCIIEWPERAGDRLPTPDLELSLAYAEDGGRTLHAAAFTDAGSSCLMALRAPMQR